MTTQQKHKKLSAFFTLVIVAFGAMMLFSAPKQAEAYFLEQTIDDFVACIKGECPDATTQTSFTQFQGGLTPPPTEGYDAGLVRQTDLRGFILNVTNFALGFLGLIAVVIIIYGGVLYVLSAGEQEKAEKGKKAITYAVIGILIILGSYAIVNTVLQAPGGEETGLRGTTEFGQTLTGTSGTVRLSLVTAKIENMALNLVSAHIFHFEAMKEMNRVKPIVMNALNEMYLCHIDDGGAICGYGTTLTSDAIANNFVSYFSREMDNAVTLLSAVKNRVTGTVIAGAFIRETIDDQIATINSYKNYAESKRGVLAANLLSKKDVFGGRWDPEDTQPAFRDTFPNAEVDTRKAQFTEMHQVTLDAVKSNFSVVVDNSVKDLAEIHEVVSAITSAANVTIDNLATQSARMARTCRDRETDKWVQPGGTLCELNQAVVESQKDTPGPADPEYRYMTDAYNELGDLYKIISNLLFVEARISANVVEGSAPLAVSFSSVGSIDPSGITIQPGQIEWDLDGDGEYNEGPLQKPEVMSCSETASATVSCIYTMPGTYRVRLKVNASDNEISADDARFPDKTKKNSDGAGIATIKYSEVIGAGIATMDIRVHEPQTKINLSIDNLEGGEDEKAIKKYENGFLTIDRSTVVVPLSLASGEGLVFDALPTITRDGGQIETQAGEGATVYWDFGDNSAGPFNKTVLAATPGNLKVNHIYENAGTYNVMVEFTDKNMVKDRKIFTLVVSSLAPRVSLSTRSAKVGEEIRFDAGNSVSDNGPISYQWMISAPGVTPVELTDEAFSRAFDVPNRYNVSLRASDPAIDNMTVTDNFEVKKSPPVAQFAYAVQDEKQPSAVTLDGTKSYDPDGTAQLEYTWTVEGITLNKGTSGSESIFTYNASDNSKPVVKFREPGTYTVSLVAVDPHGGGQNVTQSSQPVERQIIIDKVIDVAWGKVDKTAVNLAQSATGDMEARVSLTLVSEKAVAYEVDYGDGTIEQGEMRDTKILSHAYRDTGSFVVKASVFDINDDENKIQRKVFISSADKPAAVIGITVNGNPVFDLTEPLEIGRRDVVGFDAGNSINVDGTGRRLTFSWDLGDGSRSTSRTATNTYRDIGTYTVTLRVVNESDVTMTATDTISISVVGEPPTLRGLTAAPVGTNLVAPVTVQLNAIGAEDPDGRISRYRWWYYDITADRDQLGVQVTQSPTAQVTIGTRGVEGEQKTYRFAVELTDDENNTVSSNDLLAPSAIPELTITNGPNKPPIASFSVDRTNVYVGDVVNFISSSTDPDGEIVAYFWDFEGDGFADNTTNLGPNVSHVFDRPAPDGIRVRLKVRDNNESEAISQPVVIYVDSLAEPPKASFTYTQTPGTTKVRFTDTSTADQIHKLNIEKRSWNFNIMFDGTRVDSIEQNPEYEYSDYGIYRARLTVEDSDGQTSSSTDFIQVRAPQTTTGGANVLGTDTNHLFAVLVSILGFAILALSLRKINKER